MLDINKFSFAQMTSNESGKTSGSGSSGIYLVFIGGLIGIMGAIAGLFMNSPQAANVLLFATGSIGSGAALLGVRKMVGDRPNLEDKPKEETN